MSETKTQTSSGWEQIDEREEFIGGTWYLTRAYVDEQRAIVDAARAADASQIAEAKKQLEQTAKDWLAAEAQVAALSAQVEKGEKHEREAWLQVEELRAQVEQLRQEQARYENAQCITCGAHLDAPAEMTEKEKA